MRDISEILASNMGFTTTTITTATTTSTTNLDVERSFQFAVVFLLSQPSLTVEHVRLLWRVRI